MEEEEVVDPAHLHIHSDVFRGGVEDEEVGGGADSDDSGGYRGQ